MNNHILRQMILTTGFSIAGITATHAQLSEIPPARPAGGIPTMTGFDLGFSELAVPKAGSDESFSAKALAVSESAILGDAETAIQPVDDLRVAFGIRLENEPVRFETNDLFGDRRGVEADLSSRFAAVAIEESLVGENQPRLENLEVLPIPEASAVGMVVTGLVLGALALGSAAFINWRIQRAA